jgi:hypothetical protein
MKATAFLYALAVAEISPSVQPQDDPKSKKKMIALKELITEGCDAEQIWAQIQLAQVAIGLMRVFANFFIAL